MKTIKLTDEQIKLLIETLVNADTETNFASLRKHVGILPGLSGFLTDRQKALASLKELLTISLNEEIPNV